MVCVCALGAEPKTERVTSEVIIINASFVYTEFIFYAWRKILFTMEI